MVGLDLPVYLVLMSRPPGGHMGAARVGLRQGKPAIIIELDKGCVERDTDMAMLLLAHEYAHALTITEEEGHSMLWGHMYSIVWKILAGEDMDNEDTK